MGRPGERGTGQQRMLNSVLKKILSESDQGEKDMEYRRWKSGVDIERNRL